MSTYVCWYLIVCILLSIVPQRCIAWAFTRYIRRTPPRAAPLQQAPKAAVLFAIRGNDPLLKDCLAALVDQDYPDYCIHIIVDSPFDPSIALIDEIRSRTTSPTIRLQVLDRPALTCSLKNSCLIELIDGLDERFEIAAFIDGDIVPHRQWLSDLCRPLADHCVGASTGNRWYDPPTQSHWGSLVRRAWNVGAVVQMWATGIVWGGSMAMRLDALRRVGLTEIWGRSMSTDSVVSAAMRQHGYTVAFVADNIMTVREETPLDAFHRWMVRQLLVIRLYHPGWKLVLLQALSIVNIHLCAAALLAWSLWERNAAVFVAAALSIVTYWGSGLFDSYRISAALETVRRRNEDNAIPSDRFTLRDHVRYALATVHAMLLFVVCLSEAVFQRSVRWRGITYEIHRDGKIRMTGYQPFTAEKPSSGMVSVM